MIMRTAPWYHGPTYRTPPAIAPRPWSGTQARVAAPAPTRSFSGSRFYGNGYTFGGGSPSSFGGRSTGRGATFSGGSSFGGSRATAPSPAPSFGGGARSFGGHRR